MSGGMSSTRSRSGGTLQLDDVEAVEEVLAERPLGDHLRQVAVRRGDDAHVDRLLHRAAHGAHALLLQHAEQARLHLQRHLADLVEQEGAALGLLEEPLGDRGRRP